MYSNDPSLLKLKLKCEKKVNKIFSKHSVPPEKKHLIEKKGS